MFDRVLGILGVREDEGDEEEHQEQQEERQVMPEVPAPRTTTQRRNNLVSLPGSTQQIKVIIVEPTEFEQVRALVDHLKHKRPVITRLDKVERDEARRIVDFLSGSTHALDGNMRKLGDGIFLFAPTSVTLEGEMETTVFDLRKWQ